MHPCGASSDGRVNEVQRLVLELQFALLRQQIQPERGSVGVGVEVNQPYRREQRVTRLVNPLQPTLDGPPKAEEHLCQYFRRVRVAPKNRLNV